MAICLFQSAYFFLKSPSHGFLNLLFPLSSCLEEHVGFSQSLKLLFKLLCAKMNVILDQMVTCSEY